MQVVCEVVWHSKLSKRHPGLSHSLSQRPFLNKSQQGTLAVQLTHGCCQLSEQSPPSQLHSWLLHWLSHTLSPECCSHCMYGQVAGIVALVFTFSQRSPENCSGQRQLYCQGLAGSLMQVPPFWQAHGHLTSISHREPLKPVWHWQRGWPAADSTQRPPF